MVNGYSIPRQRACCVIAMLESNHSNIVLPVQFESKMALMEYPSSLSPDAITARSVVGSTVQYKEERNQEADRCRSCKLEDTGRAFHLSWFLSSATTIVC